MPFNLGPVELGLILLIVAMLFGVGKLPEVFGSIGKGVREFRKESGLNEGDKAAAAAAGAPTPAGTGRPAARYLDGPGRARCRRSRCQVPVVRPVIESKPVTTE